MYQLLVSTQFRSHFNLTDKPTCFHAFRTTSASATPNSSTAVRTVASANCWNVQALLILLLVSVFHQIGPAVS